jgi:hypothetical protein
MAITTRQTIPRKFSADFKPETVNSLLSFTTEGQKLGPEAKAS